MIVKLIQINEKKVTRENLFLSGKIKNFHFKSGKPTQIEIVNLWENCTKYISTKTEGKKTVVKKKDRLRKFSNCSKIKAEFSFKENDRKIRQKKLKNFSVSSGFKVIS